MQSQVCKAKLPNKAQQALLTDSAAACRTRKDSLGKAQISAS